MKICEICGEAKPLRTDYHKGKALGKLCKECRTFMKWADHDPDKIQRLLDYRFPGHGDIVITE